jgi:hypothetical protein
MPLSKIYTNSRNNIELITKIANEIQNKNLSQDLTLIIQNSVFTG